MQLFLGPINEFADRSQVAVIAYFEWTICKTLAFVSAAGYYTHVSTLADVQENVMEYLHVLSRPMVINHDHDIIWTEAYMDSVVSVPCLLSASLPDNIHWNVVCHKCTIIKMSYRLGRMEMLLMVQITSVIVCLMEVNIQLTLSVNTIHPWHLPLSTVLKGHHHRHNRLALIFYLTCKLANSSHLV